jgi:hypothetical protein
MRIATRLGVLPEQVVALVTAWQVIFPAVSYAAL